MTAGEKAGGQKYDIGELEANAETLFNVKPEVAAGALRGCGAAQLTTARAKDLINKFIKRRVI